MSMPSTPSMKKPNNQQQQQPTLFQSYASHTYRLSGIFWLWTLHAFLFLFYCNFLFLVGVALSLFSTIFCLFSFSTIQLLCGLRNSCLTKIGTIVLLAQLLTKNEGPNRHLEFECLYLKIQSDETENTNEVVYSQQERELEEYVVTLKIQLKKERRKK
jgi:hypothetical protein